MLPPNQIPEPWQSFLAEVDQSLSGIVLVGSWWRCSTVTLEQLPMTLLFSVLTLGITIH